MSTSRKSLLVLCHRIPFPADKGDKIRNYNFICQLSKDFTIALGCFIDDPFDEQYQSQLSQLVEHYRCKSMSPFTRLCNAMLALVQGKSVTEYFYRDRAMHQWVTGQCENVDAIFVASAAMARYIPSRHRHKAVLDFVDLDSQKWLHYAQNSDNLFKAWLYQRESRCLALYEQELAAKFKAVCFVSDAEAAQFDGAMAAHGRQHSIALPNGVDTQYFSPATQISEIDSGLIVFTGEMNYQPNIDACMWFVEQVLPRIRCQIDARFCIVGRNPTSEIKALENHYIEVTGRVADVRPFLAKANLVVAPMQLARGVKNKVLEAMAMAKPVVATSAALFGLEPLAQCKALIIKDTAESFADACIGQLQSAADANPSRQLVEQYFGWQASANTLTSLLKNANDGPKA